MEVSTNGKWARNRCRRARSNSLEVHWTGENGPQPVPLRLVRPRGWRQRCVAPPTRLAVGTATNGTLQQPFHFSHHMLRLCEDIVSRCSALHHVNMRQILIGITQARHGRRCGLQARVTPMRFRGGSLFQVRHGRLYQIQRYWVGGVETLYLLTFCLPRFMDQSFEEKLVTIFHELYHVAPEFNGDLRRHAGRYDLHTRRQKDFDHHMAKLAHEYLRNGADRSLSEFLRFRFRELHARYGQVVGYCPAIPKLIPVD